MPEQELIADGCCVITGFPMRDNLAEAERVVPQLLLTLTAYKPWSDPEMFCSCNCCPVELLVMAVPSFSHWYDKGSCKLLFAITLFVKLPPSQTSPGIGCVVISGAAFTFKVKRLSVEAPQLLFTITLYFPSLALVIPSRLNELVLAETSVKSMSFNLH